jgi:hypothetical protein
MIYYCPFFFADFFVFFAMTLPPLCSAPGGEKPSLADVQTHIRSEPAPQSKNCKKSLFFRVLTDVQVDMKEGSR